jgi:hydrogenase nickel incorporation protein HypB
MCMVCGCSTTARATITDLTSGVALGVYELLQPQRQDFVHASRPSTTVRMEQAILAKNDGLAAENRRWFESQQILALNLVSSPGSGKTSLLVRTLTDLRGRAAFSVVEGDQETINDARRIRETGCPVVQINTGTGCHLEADMLARGLEQLQPPAGSIVMIENVGNLVCPALFDLGEHCKVAILSVTEGEDKPLKYPHMFRAADLVILNKIDLLPHLSFDVQRCIDYVHQVNPGAVVLQLSASSGEGMDLWYQWIFRQGIFRQGIFRQAPSTLSMQSLSAADEQPA